MTHVLSRPDSIRQRAQNAATISGGLAVALVVAAVTGLTNDVRPETAVLVGLAIAAFVASTVLWVHVVVFPHSRSGKVDVMLDDAGTNKNEVIGVLETAAKLNRQDATAVVEKTPNAVIAEGLERANADKLKQKLKEAGATAKLSDEDYQGLVRQYEIYADEVRLRMRAAATVTGGALLLASAALVVEILQKASSDKAVTLVLRPQARSDVDRLCRTLQIVGDVKEDDLAKHKDMVQVDNVVRRCTEAITLPRRSIRAVKDDDTSARKNFVTQELDPNAGNAGNAGTSLTRLKRLCGNGRLTGHQPNTHITAKLSEDALAKDSVEVEELGRRCTQAVMLPRNLIKDPN